MLRCSKEAADNEIKEGVTSKEREASRLIATAHLKHFLIDKHITILVKGLFKERK